MGMDDAEQQAQLRGLLANFQPIYNQFLAYDCRSLVRLGMDDAEQQAQLRGLLATEQAEEVTLVAALEQVWGTKVWGLKV